MLTDPDHKGNRVVETKEGEGLTHDPPVTSGHHED